MVNVTEPPDPARASSWAQMTKRERLFACWGQLQRGWHHLDLRTASSYDMESDRVLVEYEPGGTCWIAVVRWEADETLANIERAFGTEARAKAEAVIANG